MNIEMISKAETIRRIKSIYRVRGSVTLADKILSESELLELLETYAHKRIYYVAQRKTIQLHPHISKKQFNKIIKEVK